MWWGKSGSTGRKAPGSGEALRMVSAGMGGTLHMSGQPGSSADTRYCCCHELCLCCLNLSEIYTNVQADTSAQDEP